MPIHNWSAVDDGIFHDFHHAWIEEIKRALNDGLLPDDLYALAEQQTTNFGPDIVTLQTVSGDGELESRAVQTLATGNGGAVLLASPQIQLTAESDLDFYRRKQNMVVIRHVSGDQIVAVVEIVSRGNKTSKATMRSFVQKTTEFLLQGVHLLIIDLHPPGARDPEGIHGAIWDELSGQAYAKPSKPLTLAAYEARQSGAFVRAYVQPIAIGESLPDMPLFLSEGAHIPVPLEAIYERAFAALPLRWRRVLGFV